MIIQNETTSAASAVVATFPMGVSRVQGYFNGSTANRWLQLHDAKAVPTAGDVPLRSWPLYMTAPFDQNFQNDSVQTSVGCVFVVSTTQQTYTASVDTMSLYVNGDGPADLVGTSVAGDYSTGVEVLQVWAQASGKKKLVRLEVTDLLSNGPAYVQIHCADTPATNKIVRSVLLPLEGSVDLWFGQGLDPSLTVAGTEYKGCTIALSTTQATYSAAGIDFQIKASYRD